MGKSVYQLWISQGKEKLRFPVLPSELEITNNVQNETVKVSSFGELTFIDVPSAKQVSFTSLFPKKYSPIAEYKSIPSPENAMNMLLRMSWIMAILYPIVCLFIINNQKMIAYVREPGIAFSGIGDRIVSLAAADIIILLSGLIGAIASGFVINALRKRGYQMF
ncbi:YuiB family protein [Escherichia coli]|nr:YuiB family protein [Escherichia coli]